MDIGKFNEMVNELMQKHGLTAQGWRFKWGRGKRRLGCCWCLKKTISVSHYHASNHSEDAVRDTVLHEIAHAISGHEAGHGFLWASKCREIGGNPSRVNTDKSVVMPEGKYKWFCPTCGQKGSFYRRPKRPFNRICLRCRTRIQYENPALVGIV